MKQKAEVSAYFKRFNEAENLYREIDRKDLAIELRMRLGDWYALIRGVERGRKTKKQNKQTKTKKKNKKNKTKTKKQKNKTKKDTLF
jgi:hypothetical protein